MVYGAKNCIVARVDASFGDGWFYEGAGIYRHVWLTKTDALHLGKWESTVRAKVSGNSATLDACDRGREPRQADGERQGELADSGRSGQDGGHCRSSGAVDRRGRDARPLRRQRSWPILRCGPSDEPNLYSAIVTVEAGGKARDAERVSFGVRTAVFDADKGFFLNGKSLKIQGTCNHQDHAGVGAALPDRLQWFRLGVLKEMGCNAVRTSHNMPTPEWVEACDRMGMMMMCETRQMSSNPEGLAQLEAMVKRYRNSPSIILWSIGNEEWQLQNAMAEQGAKIAATMVRRCPRTRSRRAWFRRR